MFDLRQAASASVCNSVKSNGVHTKPTSPTHQINTNTGSELKRRSKTVTENAYGNGGVPHSSSKQQKPGSQPAQRNSHIAGTYYITVTAMMLSNKTIYLE